MGDPALSAFFWSVADLLRGVCGDYKPHEYGKVILCRPEVVAASTGNLAGCEADCATSLNTVQKPPTAASQNQATHPAR